MNHDLQACSAIHLARLVMAALIFLSVALTSTETFAQSANTPMAAQSAESQASPRAPSAAQQPPAMSNSDLAQMRTDLDRMESLLGNMSSEIEFLRDQNLQILLRTNAQIWRMLISDLRRQVDREEQERSHK